MTTWLTPDCGPVTTVVKGAVRPKSMFLGQYDFFYTCELVYYARSSGGAHAIREAVPIDMREHIRGDFRSTAYASYAAYLAGMHCPHGEDAAAWYGFLERRLDGLAERPADALSVVWLELEFLSLAGLAPDFAGADFSADAVPFSIDRGRAEEGGRTVRIPAGAARLLSGGCGEVSEADIQAALRFLGVFMRHHLDMSPEIRRETLGLVAKKRRK